MSLMKLNGLATSDGIVFTAVPAGSYRAKIAGLEEKKTRADSKHYPNHPALNVKFKLFDLDDGSDKGVVFAFLMLPSEAMKQEDAVRAVSKIKRLLIACGIETKDDDLDTQDLLGSECKVIVTKKAAPGGDKNDVKDFLPL